MSRLNQRIENFNNAYDLLEITQNEYLHEPTKKINMLALTQAFEIVFELGWKVLKDFLATKDIEVFTPRDTIKAAFSANILPTAQIWIDMAQARNASSHEYNQDKINVILEKIATEYFQELQRFKNNLGNFYEQ